MGHTAPVTKFAPSTIYNGRRFSTEQLTLGEDLLVTVLFKAQLGDSEAFLGMLILSSLFFILTST